MNNCTKIIKIIKLNHIIKRTKKTYYEDQLIKYKQNSRMMWKTLNELLNRTKKNTQKFPKRLLKTAHQIY
jgi:hypothetical protein